MEKSVSQLEGDVRWWGDEIRALEGKLSEARRKSEERKRELSDAKRDEQREKEKSSTSKK